MLQKIKERFETMLSTILAVVISTCLSMIVSVMLYFGISLLKVVRL